MSAGSKGGKAWLVNGGNILLMVENSGRRRQNILCDDLPIK